MILPVVGLNQESQATFYIFNDGYPNQTLKYKVVDDLKHFNLKLSFPEDLMLAVTKNKLPVIASFFSQSPISFTTKIVFTDSLN